MIAILAVHEREVRSVRGRLEVNVSNVNSTTPRRTQDWDRGIVQTGIEKRWMLVS